MAVADTLHFCEEYSTLLNVVVRESCNAVYFYLTICQLGNLSIA